MIMTHDDSNTDAEQRWCAGLHADDPVAFEALYREFAQAVYGFCVRRCDDPGTAEDALSMVFLEAWRLRTKAKLIDGTLRPWLFSVAHNVIRNHSRANRRYASALQRFHADFAARYDASEDGGAEDRVVMADQLLIVRTAAARLSRKLRDVAELCILGELPPGQAAAVLDLPESTVRSRLALVREQLQRVLQSGESLDAAPVTGHSIDERRPGVLARESRESPA